MDVDNDIISSSVCRLCLGVSHKNFLSIDETVKRMLDVLPLKIDLSVSDKPLMCEDCGKILKMSHSFKSAYMGSEDRIRSFFNGKKVDLRDVYACNSKEAIDENTEICRLCIKKVTGNFIALDVLLNESTFSDMLHEYMLELDLNITKNPLICFHCRDNMETYFKFLRNCRDTEEKINAYQQHNRIPGDKITLINVFETFFKCKKEEISNSTMEVKEEFDMDDKEVIEPLLYQNEEHSHVSQDVLGDVIPHGEDIKVEPLLPEANSQISKIENDETTFKPEADLNEGCSQQLCLKCGSELPKTEYNCDICSYQVTEVSEQTLTQQSVPKVQMFRCDSCEFQTKHESSLKDHSVIHKDLSEVQIYKCESCEFQTKHKRNLTRHASIHKDSSDVQIYRCESCEFQSKHHRSLKRHMLVHDGSLKARLVARKNFVDAPTYQCDNCDFKTKYKRSLQDHSMTHKDLSDLEIYQCEICEFVTKYKRSIRDHLLIHKDSSDVQTFQCNHCSFQTKHKRSLKDHLLTHKDSTNTQMYQCSSCEFRTKHKRNLKRHNFFTHSRSSVVPIYQCDYCEYQTKREKSLENHLYTHKEFEGVQRFRCDLCEFRTKHKNSLKRHCLKTHKVSSVPESGELGQAD